jgi:hypothetical protein
MPTPITISANFIDLTGSAVSGYMQAAIVSPTGVYDLYVSGTGIIVPKFSTSGTGTSVSVSVWGNDVVIDMADGAKDTYYTVTLFNTNNIPIWTAAYLLTGSGPINLVGYPSLTIVPAPTGTVPTNILTGNNVFTGSNTFTGPVSFASLSAALAFLTVTPVTVAYSATPTFNAASASVFQITLTGNVTSSTLSGAVAGQFLLFQIIENGTGGYTFVWPSNVKGAMGITTAASTRNQQLFWFDGTNAYPVAPGTWV